MLNYKIAPPKTALLVFDMLNDFIKPGAPLENVDVREILLPRLKQMIPACRAQGITIIYTSHAHRPDGSDVGLMVDRWPSVREKRALIKGTEGVQVYAEIAPQDGDVVIEKCRYSAFYGTDLEMVLKTKGIDTLIITGAATNVGCESTARDAAIRDYRVIVLSDGTVCRDMPDMGWGPIPKEVVQKVVLSTLAHAFGTVISIDELLAEIQ